MIITKEFNDIKPILMDAAKKGVKNPFYQILADGQIIFVVAAGLNGVEFNKTDIFFNNLQTVAVYQCLYGQGIILMQRLDQMGEAKEFKVVSISSGRQVAIPAGWAVNLVNVGKSFLVVLANTELNNVNSKEIVDKQGLAYYVVEKKGEIGFEPNMNYRVHPQISTE